jgi:hypothetical protein
MITVIHCKRSLCLGFLYCVLVGDVAVFNKELVEYVNFKSSRRLHAIKMSLPMTRPSCLRKRTDGAPSYQSVLMDIETVSETLDY